MCSELVRVAIAGAGGRMGTQLIQAALQTSSVVLGAVLEREGSKLLGVSVRELVHVGSTQMRVQSSLTAIKDDFDVFVDFTHPEGTLKHLAYCRRYGKAMVIGTTGFSIVEKEALKSASQEIPIVFSANFSVGANIILKFLQTAGKLISKETDIQIIDVHHRYKVDSPSGTAIEMGEVVAQSMGKDLEACLVDSKKSSTENRVTGIIGLTSIRLGDTTGEHTVIFSNAGERIELIHRSFSRMIYANGAMRSALWVKSKKGGLFSMKDVLNLEQE